MTQPPQQPPPTQGFAQQRRSGCGTLLVALLVLAIITAIVIFLGAFGLLGSIFRLQWQRGHAASSRSPLVADGMTGDVWIDQQASLQKLRLRFCRRLDS